MSRAPEGTLRMSLHHSPPRLFLDLDGVLADFDAHHKATFGFSPCKIAGDADWRGIQNTKDFYLNLPPMSDMRELWDAVKHLEPTIITGVPFSVPEAPDNKKAWVRKHLGSHVEVICCRSSQKFVHGSKGDILIDDWPRYEKAWKKMGGIWITHINAQHSIARLKDLQVI